MRRRDRGLATLAGIVFGASAWTASGQLAVVTQTGAPQFVGLLPSFLWLLTAIGMGIATAIWATSRGTDPALFLLPVISALPWTTWISSPAIVAWTGPAALLPFSLTIVGALRNAIRWQQWPTALIDGRWTPAIAAALTGVWLGALLLFTAPLALTGDEPHYLLATQSLLTDGDLDLANNYDLGTYRSFYAGSLEPRHVALGVLGQQYSFHGPALSLLLLPGFAAGGVFGARLTQLFIVAAGAGFFWAAARRLTQSSIAAWASWIALIVAAPFAWHGLLLYPDGLGAAVTCMAVWALIAVTHGTPPSLAALIGSSAALALSPWLHIRLSLSAGVLGLAILWTLWSSRRRDLILPYMTVPVISLVLWIASTWVMFGTVDPTAVFRQKAAGTLSQLPIGTLGLLFDAEYGLFVYAPILALATLGIVATWKRDATVATASLALAALTLGTGGSWIWWGGDSAPARFLAPVVPLATLWLAAWWTTASNGSRALASALIVVTMGVTLCQSLAEQNAFIVNQPDGQSTIFGWLSPNVDLSLALPSLFRVGAVAGEEAIVAALWTAIGLVAVAACRRATWLTASIALMACLTAGAAGGWWRHGVVPWTPDRAQLALLHAAPTPALTLGIHEHAFVTRDAALASLEITTAANATTLLHVPFVPSGRYAVRVESATATVGRESPALSLELGRDAWPFATWPSSDAAGAPTFTLASPIWAVRVTAAAPMHPAPRVTLIPLSVDTSDRSTGLALRATRYGDLVLYSRDPFTYIERNGFWLAGDRQGSFTVASLDGREVAYTAIAEAGPAAVTVHLTSPSADRTVTLPPGGSARVDVDATRHVLLFAVSGGFPSPSGDGRRLGAFVRLTRR